MAPQKDSQDAIYVEYGKFKAGATGRVAVTFFVALVVGTALTKLLGLW